MSYFVEGFSEAPRGTYRATFNIDLLEKILDPPLSTLIIFRQAAVAEYVEILAIAWQSPKAAWLSILFHVIISQWQA